MKLSKKSEYAIKALIELAINYKKGVDVTLINDIAKRKNIPPRYLEQILLSLKNFGILASKRGVGGGYALNKPPKTISLGDVIRAIEGPLSSLYSLDRAGKSGIEDETSSALYSVMAEVGSAIRDIVNNVSLENIARRTLDLIEDKKGVLSYAI